MGGSKRKEMRLATQSAELVTFNQGGRDYGASLEIKTSVLNICHIVGNCCVYYTAEC